MSGSISRKWFERRPSSHPAEAWRQFRLRHFEQALPSDPWDRRIQLAHVFQQPPEAFGSVVSVEPLGCGDPAPQVIGRTHVDEIADRDDDAERNLRRDAAFCLFPSGEFALPGIPVLCGVDQQRTAVPCRPVTRLDGVDARGDCRSPWLPERYRFSSPCARRRNAGAAVGRLIVYVASNAIARSVSAAIDDAASICAALTRSFVIRKFTTPTQRPSRPRTGTLIEERNPSDRMSA